MSSELPVMLIKDDQLLPGQQVMGLASHVISALKLCILISSRGAVQAHLGGRGSSHIAQVTYNAFFSFPGVEAQMRERR